MAGADTVVRCADAVLAGGGLQRVAPDAATLFPVAAGEKRPKSFREGVTAAFRRHLPGPGEAGRLSATTRHGLRADARAPAFPLYAPEPTDEPIVAILARFRERVVRHM